ncbi:MAG: hypothetical protein ACRDHY_17630, partial [Anaerolineales bacterium]
MAEAPVSPDSFEQVAAQITAGVDKAGGWKGVSGAIANGVAEGAALIVGVVLNLLTFIGVFIARTLLGGLREVDPAISQIVQLAVADMFGTDFPKLRLEFGAGSAATRRAENAAIGHKVMAAIAGQITARPGGLVPDDSRAAEFLGLITNMGLQNWWEGILAETISLGQIEGVMDLNDKIAESLGFGRLSRRVLGPLIGTVVTLPMEWKVNSLYRPTELSQADAIRRYLQGSWTDAELNGWAAKAGHTDAQIRAIVDLHQQRFSPPELVRLAELNLISADESLAELRAQGYDAVHAARAESLAAVQALDQWATPVVSAARDAYIE